MTGNLKHSNLMGTATASFTSEGDLVISFVSEFSRPYPPHIRTHKAPIPIRTEYYIPPISELSSPPYPNAQSSDHHQNRIFTYPPYPNSHLPHIRTHKAPIPIRTEFLHTPHIRIYIPPISEFSSFFSSISDVFPINPGLGFQPPCLSWTEGGSCSGHLPCRVQWCAECRRERELAKKVKSQATRTDARPDCHANCTNCFDARGFAWFENQAGLRHLTEVSDQLDSQ